MISLMLLTLGCTGTGTGDCDTAGTCGDSGTASSALDLLLVIDASPSMQEESSDLILGLETLVDGLAGRGAQAHVTTIDVEAHAGAHVGGVDLDAGDALGSLQTLVACEAVCWTGSDLTSDPDYTSGGSLTAISWEWLDDVCGIDAWANHCGSGQEEGLETTLEAACRGGGSVPDACFDDVSVLTSIEADTSLGLWRDDNRRVAVVVTDEGDSSRRVPIGDGDATPYSELYASFEIPLEVAIIGPPLDGTNLPCSTTVESWGVARYQQVAEDAGMPYEPIAEHDGTGDCTPGVADALAVLVDSL